MSQHSRPFWGFPQGAWTRRKAAADGNEAGSVKTAWVGAKGLRDGPGTEKGSEAWLARRGSSQEDHTVNSLGWAERHGNRAGVADSLAWREGGKVGCQARQDRLGWREGAKSASKQDTNWCADSLAWRKGVR